MTDEERKLREVRENLIAFLLLSVVIIVICAVVVAVNSFK